MILGIDPGTRKCGYALLPENGGTPVEIGIVETPQFGAFATALVARHPVRAIALGGGTHAPPISLALRACGIPVHIVDERETTLRARFRYFQDNPPKGWRRWIPRGMLLPPRPIDDYAALLIAERYVEASLLTEPAV